jgi:pyruvate/2-oxoglutarate dehydrogenase complex dihydrolipoamide acyltransferase (E2) component
MTMDCDLYPFPPEREIIVDAGYLGAGRHIIYALVEVDVTRARAILRAVSAEQGRTLSFTAFVVASLAQAIESHAKVQAYRDWRHRLVVFHDVDVVTMIEPEPGAVAIPRIIRSANRKTVFEISDEIRSLQSKPDLGEQRDRLSASATRMPRFVRLLFFRLLKKNPYWFKRMSGTAIVSSVGMFGKGGGWGMGFLPLHTLGVLVGGIAPKPGVHEGAIAIREYLNLTISFDHDIVDGAPAARFVRSLADLVEGASVLEMERVEQSSDLAV